MCMNKWACGRAAADNEEIISMLSLFLSPCLFPPLTLTLFAPFLLYFSAFRITVLLFLHAYFLPHFPHLALLQKERRETKSDNVFLERESEREAFSDVSIISDLLLCCHS